MPGCCSDVIIQPDGFRAVRHSAAWLRFHICDRLMMLNANVPVSHGELADWPLSLHADFVINFFRGDGGFR